MLDVAVGQVADLSERGADELDGVRVTIGFGALPVPGGPQPTVRSRRWRFLATDPGRIAKWT
jgi:hypothetical protein